MQTGRCNRHRSSMSHDSHPRAILLLGILITLSAILASSHAHPHPHTAGSIRSHRQQAYAGELRTRALLQTLAGSAAAAPGNRSTFSKVHPSRPQQLTASASAALAKDKCTVLRHLQACSHRATTAELDTARSDAARTQVSVDACLPPSERLCVQ